MITVAEILHQQSVDEDDNMIYALKELTNIDTISIEVSIISINRGL
jgi:hypothetical protein